LNRVDTAYFSSLYHRPEQPATHLGRDYHQLLTLPPSLSLLDIGLQYFTQTPFSMATAWSSENDAAAAAAAMQADIGAARRTLITQAPDEDDRFHDRCEEESLQTRRHPDPNDSHVLNAWNCK
jgi:hypothetical protein